MKKVQQLLVAVGAVLLSCSNAYADNPATASAGATSGANSQSAGNGIVGQTIQTGVQVNLPSAPADMRAEMKTDVNVSGTQVLKNVPSMGAPGLTTSMSETCMGSVSGSVAIAGVGIGGGKTYTDYDCVNRLNAREIINQRQPGAQAIAKEILCSNEVVRMASKKAGYPCMDDMPSASGASSVSSADTPKMSTAEAPAVVKVFPSQVAESKSSILDDSRFKY